MRKQSEYISSRIPVYGMIKRKDNFFSTKFMSQEWQGPIKPNIPPVPAEEKPSPTSEINAIKKEKYKTIIIGTGPAGLRCAKILAENKEDFILLEEKENIYRKICTGMYGLASSSSNKTGYFSLPDNLYQIKINKVILHHKNKKREVILKEPFVATVDRRELSQWMYGEAKKSGAKIIFNARVAEIGNDYIVVNGRKIFFENLVGADGSNSLVRRHLKLKTSPGIGIQYWIEGIKDWIEIYLDPEKFGSWYAWITPHKNKVSVGTGGDLREISAEKMKNNLKYLFREKKIILAQDNLEGAYINYCYKGYRFGNKFLVGDAAGFASGLTGEGIYPAIASGEDVAKIIINKNHKPALIKEILNKKKKLELIMKIFRNKIIANLTINLLFFLLKYDYFKKKIVRFIA